MMVTVAAVLDKPKESARNQPSGNIIYYYKTTIPKARCNFHCFNSDVNLLNFQERFIIRV